jgi:asparagine synthase (glutamine-hydrolysing)
MNYFLDIMQYTQIYGLITHKYWDLETKECNDNSSTIQNKIYSLIKNSTKIRLEDDEKIGIIYPESINSCILSAITKKITENVNAYSYNIIENSNKNKNAGYTKVIKKHLNIDNYNIISNNNVLYSLLIPAMLSKDIPGKGFTDSTKLEFLTAIKKTGLNKCVSSLYSNEIIKINDNTFPLCLSSDFRTNLINKKLLDSQNIKDYINERYNEYIKNITYLPNESNNKGIRTNKYVNMKWKLPLLIENLHHLSSSIDIDIILPYLDHRILEYIYNLNDSDITEYLNKIYIKLFDETKHKEDVQKLNCDSNYLGILEHEIKKILNDSSSKLLKIIDKSYILAIINSKGTNIEHNKNDSITTYEQILAYLIQIEYWLNIYEIELEF